MRKPLFKAAGDIHAFECADMLEQPLSGLICPFPFLGQLVLDNNDYNSNIVIITTCTVTCFVHDGYADF